MLRRTPKGSPGGIWRKVPERLQQAAMKTLSVNPYALPNFIVGADAGHIRNAPLSRTAVTGIGLYKVSANSYSPATFERRADLPQSFKGNCYQTWCTVTGGAYQSARKVSMCVRND